MTGQQTLFDVGHLSDMSDTVSKCPTLSENYISVRKSIETPLAGKIDILTKLWINTEENTRAAVSDMSDMSDMSDSNVECRQTRLWIEAFSAPTVRPDCRGTMPRFGWLAYCQQCESKTAFTDYDEREVWVAEHRRAHPEHRLQKDAGKL